MRRPALAAFVLFPFVVSCGDWPDLPETPRGSTPDTWPALLSEAELFPELEPDPSIEKDAAILAARAAALRRRADLLRTPVENEADFERLRNRIGT